MCWLCGIDSCVFESNHHALPPYQIQLIWFYVLATTSICGLPVRTYQAEPINVGSYIPSFTVLLKTNSALVLTNSKRCSFFNALVLAFFIVLLSLDCETYQF